MQNYIVQKAQQALEAICEEAPLPERLETPRRHFEQAAQHLETAPEDVRKTLKAFIGSDIKHDIRSSSLSFQSAVESVFEEAGREDVTLGKSGDPTPYSN